MSFDSLPTGWAIAKVAQSVGVEGIISDGDWVESKDQDPNGDVRLIQLADIGDGDFRNKSERFMTKPNAIRMNCTFLEDGDVLIARMPDPLGRACIFPGVGQEAVTVVDVCLVRLPDGSALLNKILMHWINNPEVRNVIALQTTGTTRKRITRKKLEELELPIPPLAEQHQIAAKLDELLAHVDSIKARLDTIPKILKRFRQSVLAAAVSGKLTEYWRENNKNISVAQISKIQKFWAEEYSKNNKKYKAPNVSLTEQTLNQLPETWLGTQIGFVFDVYVGATPSRTEDSFWNGNINWVSSSEVAFCKIIDTKEKITPKGLASASTCIHSPGTVMLAMIGQGKTRGQAAILEVEACHNQNTAALRVPSEFAASEYLYFYLCKQYEETRRVGSGNNQQALNKASVQSLAFPLPPIEEQTEIVRRVEQLFTYADQIEQRVKDAQSRVNHLTQSILAKAFRGELTADWRAQNPDMISGDNSAEALLNKIKAECLKTKQKKGNR